jgi:hypothetical protein
VLAAVIVAIALVSGGGRSARHRPSLLDVSVVVRKTSARVKELGASDGVLHVAATSNQQRTPLMSEWIYTDPQTGIRYDHERNFNSRGRYNYGYWDREWRLGRGRVKNTALEIEPLLRSYGVQTGTSHVRVSTQPGAQDSAHQIAEVLDRGHVTLGGQTRVQGQRALRLRLRNASGTSTLYVNADTYEPIEQVTIHRYHHGREVITDHIYLRPATAANIARAADRPDLKGYTKR